MNYAIKVSGLRKSYGSHIVLNGLGFQIKKGKAFSLLGVNGAGKTTSLECIEGLKKYDSGTITINGKMGIQLQSSSLPACIKPMEAVKLFAKWNTAEIDCSMLNTLGIREIGNKQYARLSTGQKRQLHLSYGRCFHFCYAWYEKYAHTIYDCYECFNGSVYWIAAITG